MSNREAFEATFTALKDLGRIEPVDYALVESLRTLADTLDQVKRNSQLYREYREGLGELIGDSDDDGGIDELLEFLRSPVRDSSA